VDAGIVIVAFLIVAQVVTTLEAQHKARKLDALADQVSTLAKRIKRMEGIIKQADAIVEQHRLAAHADQAAVPAVRQAHRPVPEPAEGVEGSHADLVEEINRLRAENAVLSGAYQFVLLEENGRRRMVRFDLN
jgi:hypothetical protein